MTVDINALAQQDAAAMKQARDKQPDKDAPKAKPDIFMSDPGNPVPVATLHAAVTAADHMGPIAHPIYHKLRDAVVYFASDYKPGENKLNDAIARLLVPLVGYARMLGYVQRVTEGRHVLAHRGTMPSHTVNFADLHAMGLHTQHAFVEVLKLADPRAHISHINFVTGALSEQELSGELRKHVKPDQAEILTLAAAVIKDGLYGTRTAMEGGARTLDDVIPPSVKEEFEEHRRLKGERRKRALESPESRAAFKERYGHEPEVETLDEHSIPAGSPDDYARLNQ